MAESRLSVRVNADIKQKAEAVFEQLGLSLSAGVNIYLTRVAKQRRLPFDLNMDEQNEQESKDEADIYTVMKSMELQAQAVVESEIETLRSHGIPVALYDGERHESYLMYPDGTRIFGIEQPAARKAANKKCKRHIA